MVRVFLWHLQWRVPTPANSKTPTLGPVPWIMIAEVKLAIEKMKRGKATGPDDIPTEVRKTLGDRGANFLANLFNWIVAENKPHHAWTTSTTVSIWKCKGGVGECANYQPIWLLCYAMKIMSECRTVSSEALSASRQTNVVSWRDVAPLKPFILLDCWWWNIKRSTRRCRWPSWTWRKHLTGSPMISSGECRGSMASQRST